MMKNKDYQEVVGLQRTNEDTGYILQEPSDKAKKVTVRTTRLGDMDIEISKIKDLQGNKVNIYDIRQGYSIILYMTKYNFLIKATLVGDIQTNLETKRKQPISKPKLDKPVQHSKYEENKTYNKDSRQDIPNSLPASKNINPVEIEAKSYIRVKYIGQVTNISDKVKVIYSKGDDSTHHQNIDIMFFEVIPNIGDIVEFTIQNREIIEVYVQPIKLNDPIESSDNPISKHSKIISSQVIQIDPTGLDYMQDYQRGNSVTKIEDTQAKYSASANPKIFIPICSSPHSTTLDLTSGPINLNPQENEASCSVYSISQTETLYISPPMPTHPEPKTSKSTNTCSNYSISKVQHISIPSTHHHTTISTLPTNTHRSSISHPLNPLQSSSQSLTSSLSAISSSSQSISYSNLISSLLTSKLKTVAEHRLPIFSLHLFYTDNIQYHTRVSSITPSFQSWRRVRVDSNSFYRAIGVAYLEHLFTASTSISEVRYFLTRIDHLLSTIASTPDSIEILSFRNSLSELYNYKTRIGSAILILQDYLKDVCFNRSMILSLRYLAYMFLQHLVSMDSSSYLDTGNFTLARIRDMNEEAEREEYSLMAETLGVKIENYTVYKEIKVEEFSPRMAQHICTTIKLLQKATHFDILYSREDNIRDGYDPEGMKFRINSY